MPGVKDTPWHSRAAALCAAVPPCLPFRLVLCLHGAKRLLSSAAVVSLSMEKAPLALAAWRCPALSCPVLSHPGAVPPAHPSVPGAVLLGTTAVLLLSALCSWWSQLMVTAEERREKMSALMCCRAWHCCGTQHTQEPQTASCSLLSQGVLMIWGALTTRILQGTSPLSHLWDSRG